MNIQECGRTGATPQSFEIHQAHEIRDYKAGKLGWVLDLMGKIQRRAAHSPLPETGWKGVQLQGMPGALLPTFGKFPVRAAVKGFQE
jgi:hypothetical protein